jgi:hypothetical protein
MNVNHEAGAQCIDEFDFADFFNPCFVEFGIQELATRNSNDVFRQGFGDNVSI